MSPELLSYIDKYGYLAIFLLVFTQEIGFPNPIPNELVLFFSGYLGASGQLSFPLVFLTVVLADLTGTSLLYVVFYFFDKFILKHKPRWLHLPEERINKFSEKISSKGKWQIFVGRLIPYLRAYVSVAAGLLRIRPKSYLSMVLLSAILWSGGYAVAGFIFAPYWQNIMNKFGDIQTIFLIVSGAVLITIVSGFVIRYYKNLKKLP